MSEIAYKWLFYLLTFTNIGLLWGDCVHDLDVMVWNSDRVELRVHITSFVLVPNIAKRKIGQERKYIMKTDTFTLSVYDALATQNCGTILHAAM